MPDDIKGIFFENQILTAKGLGAFGNATISDGILTGCKVSASGLNVTISEGYIMICGRVAKIPQTNFVLTSSTAGSGRFDAIVATVDTNGTSSEDSFNQVTLSKVEGGTTVLSPIASLHSGYDPVNEFTYDINMGGQTASVWLAICNAFRTTCSVSMYNYASSLSMDLLWKNDAPTSGFDAQTLTIPVLNKYDAVLVTYRKNNESSGYYRQSMICPFDRISGNFYYDIVHSTLSDSAPYTNVMRQRRMTITPASGTIYFTSGWLTGTSDQNAGRLIPLEIYGLRAGSVRY